MVTAEGSQNLLVVDIESRKILKEIQTQEDVSHMVAATPDFKKAFVPSIRTGNLAVLNLETGKLTDHIFSGEGAKELMFHLTEKKCGYQPRRKYHHCI